MPVTGRRVSNSRAITVRHWATRGGAATALAVAGVLALGALAGPDRPAASEATEALDIISASAEAAPKSVSRDTERAPIAEADTADTTTLFVTKKTDIRSGATKDAAVLATLKKRDKVLATGETEGDFTQIVHNELPRWVASNALSDKEPALEPEEGGISSAPCPRARGVEGGLQPAAVKALRGVCARFPDIKVYGGRQPRGTHGTGHSVDIMVSGQRGHEVARYLQARSSEFNLYYLIYEQKIWYAGRGSGWQGMADRGSITQNHFDHVHMTVRGG